jgi:predicted ATPase/signal transduction histidine kinase
MISVPGYRISKEPVYKVGKFSFYHILNAEGTRTGILKFAEAGDINETKQLGHEYEFLKTYGNDIEYTGVPALMILKEGTCLLYKDFQYIMLEEFLQTIAPNNLLFLKISSDIASALAIIHARGIVHKDIKPQNIFIDPLTREIKITGFGISSDIQSDHLISSLNPAVLEGTFAYMSPEQTGRINRVTDSRTDIYSLGITMYRMFTGRLPFDADNPVEWIYSHISIIPRAPHIVVPEVPLVVSEIIMKLISKLPDDRYQSAHGLFSDLQECIKQLEENLTISKFSLGTKDVSPIFRISQKIYGREKERSYLLTAYDDVVNKGNAALVLVSGGSGVGKSALVNELLRPVAESKGFFVSGKFDQYKREFPYFSLIEAFKTIVRLVLFESQDVIEQWKLRIEEAVGVNGQVITDIIPQVKLIIGEQKPVPALPPSESGKRFEMVVMNFITVFAKQEHPLTIFLDDLQWADIASLNLINKLLTNNENKYIFIIGAFRDFEVPSSHPLFSVLSEIKASETTVREITLQPLSRDNITRLIADTLKSKPEDIQDLSDLVYEKTAGNPFFAIQFLKSMYQDGLLQFDPELLCWKWNQNKTKEKNYTDNVIDLLVNKIKRLDPVTQYMLAIGACVGNTFPVKILAEFTGNSEEDVTRKLRPALKESLLIPFNHSFRFLHDKVQQAAYQWNPGGELKEIHTRIGRILFKNIGHSENDEQIFEIVNQFNLGDPVLLSTEERLALAGLYLQAAGIAISSVAYESALKYYESGINLLPENSWTDHHELMFKLQLGKAESEYLNGKLNSAAKQIDLLSENDLVKAEKAAVCVVKMRVNLSGGEIQVVVNTALKTLEMFGIYIPLKPTKRDVYAVYKMVNDLIGERDIEELINLPVAENSDVKAAMSILSELYGPAYFFDSSLYFLHLAEMVKLSLENGNTDASVLAYGAFGFALVATSGEYEKGYRFAELGVKLARKYEFLTFNARAIFFQALTSFWRKDINTCISLFRQSYLAALETGDIQIAGYSCSQYIIYLSMRGERLDEFYFQLQGFIDFVRKVKFIDMEVGLISYQAFAMSMQGLTYNVSTFSSISFNEIEFEKSLLKRIPLEICWYYILKLKAKCISGSYDDAESSAVMAKKFLGYSSGMAQVIDYYLYYSLVLTAKFSTASDEVRSEYIKILTYHEDVLKKYSENTTGNIADKFALVKAEIRKIQGNYTDAMHLYEEAIRTANANNFLPEEALSYERAAQFYLDGGFDKIGELYMKTSRDCYKTWGAYGKVKQLEAAFPFLVKPVTDTFTTLEGIPVDKIDILSVINSLRNLSGEIFLDKILGTLMKIVVEQSGAQKGCFLIWQENEPYLATEAFVTEKGIEIKVHAKFKVPEPFDIPQSIINYVVRTNEKMILQDAGVGSIISNDSYIRRFQPKSVCCIPIYKHLRMVGILYLENNIFKNSFARDKVLLIEILASHVADSIENARLFKELERARSQLQGIIDNSNAVIFAKYRNGRYLFVNRQHELLFNIPSEKIVNFTDHDFLPSEIADQITANDREVFDTGKSIIFEESIPLRDGIHSYVSVKFPLRNAEGLIYAVCGISTDISELKRIQENLGRKTEELTVANEELQDINSMLKRVNSDLDYFVYTASHDLKLPIANMEGLLAAMKEEVAAGNNPEIFLNHIETSVLRLKDTINDLTEIARIHKEKVESTENVCLHELLDEVEESIDLMVKETGAVITEDFQVSCILYNRKNFYSILYNLITNAIKYRSPERAPCINISTQDSAEFSILKVSDNGLGFSPGNKLKAFGMFKRFHTHVEGTGIGLYIVKRIIENSGGKVELSSTEGEGSTFVIYFNRIRHLVSDRIIIAV